MPINLDILNTLIENQKDAIKYQFLFASIVVILGVCLIIISYSLATISDDSIKPILTIGGGFISTISAYPINQIITRKERIKTYRIFQLRINDMDASEIKRVEDMIWKSIEKII